MVDLTVELAGLRLKNPVLLASGTCGYGRELSEYFDLASLGGIMVKGTTLRPRSGNITPRIAETPAGLLNSVGLQNPGVKKVIETEIPWLAKQGLGIIVNIAGESPADYAAMAETLDPVAGIDALEVNISCPNVEAGGLAFGTDAKVAADIISWVRAKTKLPVIAKLSPNVTDITEIARAVEAAGADIISLINTLQGMVIDVETGKPVLSRMMGGLSGPAVKPVAVRMVWQVYKAVKTPIIGMGGITTAADALEFIMAGAKAVAIGSATLTNPCAALNVAEGLAEWLVAKGVANINELVGIAHRG